MQNMLKSMQFAIKMSTYIGKSEETQINFVAGISDQLINYCSLIPIWPVATHSWNLCDRAPDDNLQLAKFICDGNIGEP